MEETKEFKVGDRVYWAGDDFNEKDNGTIKSFRNSESVWVLWDSDGGVLWVDLDELQHEQPEDTKEFEAVGQLNEWALVSTNGYLVPIFKLRQKQPVVVPEEHSITFYNIQDDIPIGGFAKVGNEVFKVVKEEWCVNCEFEMLSDLCNATRCTSDKRADKNSVSFIIYDTIPVDNDE